LDVEKLLARAEQFLMFDAHLSEFIVARIDMDLSEGFEIENFDYCEFLQQNSRVLAEHTRGLK
jgi:nucleoside 2-deoxyribosyltransferase